ncbi:hypothetical protein SAMN04487949_1819 [Halogranum gelatinilyticum]|uniref:Uncharacterized protein n=1 Tax=Halogranum gelatinilyticum TaxID=660521 RepID=A0A1G9TLR2_9EURY|nr:hypothetical protein [Halogranum gelatinilyticum]SDM48488.1 hypothetical protein SAMN04487949_1819 [Halogranum gelatinilyticum]
MDFTKKGLVGIVLMVVGTLAFIPGLFPGATTLESVLLVPAAAALTYGTYLVGTEGQGRPV